MSGTPPSCAKVARSRRICDRILEQHGKEAGQREAGHARVVLLVLQQMDEHVSSRGRASSQRRRVRRAGRRSPARSAARSVPTDVQRRGRRGRRSRRRARGASCLRRAIERVAGRLERDQAGVAHDLLGACPARSAGRRRDTRRGGSAPPRPCSAWRPARSCRRAAMSWIWSQNSRRALASTPAVGSSSSSSCGSCSMQAASASRCFQPPESCPASWSRAVGEAHALEHVGDRSRCAVGQLVERGPRIPGSRAIVRSLVEAEPLRHVADLQPDRARPARSRSRPRQVPPPASGRQQSAQHADRRGLAAAVGARESRRSRPPAPACRGRRPPCARRSSCSGRARRWRARSRAAVRLRAGGPSTGWPGFSSRGGRRGGRASIR